ncbi:MAG: pseudouridine-5'-phosphate glycosidase [Firmicutes bacterium]|nr:pseudouridine-5'-phosphate glycosidase [Bacillota bacterium]MBE3590879.1 pseudouridine-5'-phosphate glycosidase [Bacillota bacterium]
MEIAPEVRAALAAQEPCVALETTIVTHGLPHPQNLETARACEAAVRREGAVPVTIGVVDGRAVVGLAAGELERLAQGGPAVRKIAARDLGPAVAQGASGGTTVSATARLAARAGLRVFATGGLGGVHRGARETWDVSADLYELARSPVAVFCAGAKAILDLPATAEMLETLGVLVLGWRCDTWPAFYAAESDVPVEHRVETPEECAAVLAAHWEAGGRGAVVLVPPPPGAALPRAEAEAAVQAALEEMAARGVRGKAVTPFLLSAVERRTGGRSLAANRSLVEHNAAVAARVARALAGRR